MYKGLIGITLLATLCTPSANGEWGDARQVRTPAAPAIRRSPAELLSRLPVAFEANGGQFESAIRFQAKAGSFRAIITDSEVVLVLPRGTPPSMDRRQPGYSTTFEDDVLRMRFRGASPSIPVASGRALPGRSHYFMGNDPEKWVTGVPSYPGVLHRDLWPGIDLRWKGNPRKVLEYDFIVHPGAEVASVSLEFDGASHVGLDGNGDLLMSTPGGVLRHSRPSAWQDIDGRRVPVVSSFVQRGENRVGISIGRHDPRTLVVVDPVLKYSSFLGGTDEDDPYGIAAGSDGSAYVVGRTRSTNFPVASPYRSTHSGGATDVFVSKVAANGGSLVYSTYLGTSGADEGFAIAVDSNGAAVLTGNTTSGSFPLKNAVQSTKGSASAIAFITRLSPSGAALDFSTYMGGTSGDYGQGIAIDGAGSILVTGVTYSSDFPTVAALDSSFGTNGTDGFAVKLSSSGTSVTWSTFLGHVGVDSAQGIAVDGNGDVYVVGNTNAAGFPTSNPFQAAKAGGTTSMDGFLTKISANGTSRIYSTFLGGSGEDICQAVAVDSAGSAWVVGKTTSTDFPLQSPLRSQFSGTNEGFVTKFSSSGSSLLFSSYLGGNSLEYPVSLALDTTGDAYVGGYTGSSDFPKVDPLPGTESISGAAFITNFASDGSSILWSTLLKGAGTTYGLAVDGTGRVLATGTAFSSAFPITGGFQSTISGAYHDGFVLAMTASPPPVPPSAPTNCKASLSGLTSALVTWTDTSAFEKGFVVERSTGGGGFSTVGSMGPDMTSYQDLNLTPSTTYTYRVHSYNDVGPSSLSNESAVVTPAPPTGPPAAPTLLEALVISPRQVDLNWTDNSDNEDFFLIARAVDQGLFSVLATPGLGTAKFSDSTVVPEQSYTYRVRAVNPHSSSMDTNQVTVVMPSTLETPLLKGSIKDSPRFGKDTLVLSGSLTYLVDAANGSFDPSTQSFAIRLGDFNTSPLVNIPTQAEEWKFKKGKFTWKSPRGSITKAKIVVDTTTNSWTARVSKLTLPSAPANPVRVTLTLGTDTGHVEADWTAPTKAGVIKFPVPLPK